MMLTYLNPYRAITTLLHFCDSLQKEWEVHFKNTTTLRIVVHCAFALERTITNENLQYKDPITDEKRKLLSKVKKASAVIEKEMNLTLPDEELCYVVDLLQDEFSDPLETQAEY